MQNMQNEQSVKVHLKDLSFDLKPPLSLAAAFDVATALQQNPARGMYACLGLCWGGPKPLRAKFSDQYDALQYGGQIFDELLAYGCTVPEITEASTAALSVLVAALPSDKEVQASEGNSEGQEG